MSDDLPTTNDPNQPARTSQTPPRQQPREHAETPDEQVIDAEFWDAPDDPDEAESTLDLTDQDTFVAELQTGIHNQLCFSVPYPILEEHNCVDPDRPRKRRLALGTVTLTVEHPRTHARATIREPVGPNHRRNTRVYPSKPLLKYWNLSEGDQFKAHIEEFTPNPDTLNNGFFSNLF